MDTNGHEFFRRRRLLHSCELVKFVVKNVGGHFLEQELLRVPLRFHPGDSWSFVLKLKVYVHPSADRNVCPTLKTGSGRCPYSRLRVATGGNSGEFRYVVTPSIRGHSRWDPSAANPRRTPTLRLKPQPLFRDARTLQSGFGFSRMLDAPPPTAHFPSFPRSEGRPSNTKLSRVSLRAHKPCG